MKGPGEAVSRHAASAEGRSLRWSDRGARNGLILEFPGCREKWQGIFADHAQSGDSSADWAAASKGCGKFPRRKRQGNYCLAQGIFSSRQGIHSSEQGMLVLR